MKRHFVQPALFKPRVYEIVSSRNGPHTLSCHHPCVAFSTPRQTADQTFRVTVVMPMGSVRRGKNERIECVLSLERKRKASSCQTLKMTQYCEYLALAWDQAGTRSWYLACHCGNRSAKGRASSFRILVGKCPCRCRKRSAFRSC